MRTGLDMDRIGLRLQIVSGIRFTHPRVELEYGYPIAVDGYFDQLFQTERAHRRATHESTKRLVVHGRLEDVLTIRREDVSLGDAPARADRRAFDVRHLRLGARDLEGDRR